MRIARPLLPSTSLIALTIVIYMFAALSFPARRKLVGVRHELDAMLAEDARGQRLRRDPVALERYSEIAWRDLPKLRDADWCAVFEALSSVPVDVAEVAWLV